MEIAKEYRVSYGSVKLWYDEGKFLGFRFKGSDKRYVPGKNLADFIEKYPIEIDQPYFTTGKIAKITGISTNTIAKLIDKGTIKGIKKPLSNHRIVLRSDLIKFMRDNGLSEFFEKLIPK